MPLETVTIELANPADLEATQPIEFLVDSGAVYSVAPAEILDQLGIHRLIEHQFRLWDGSTLVRKKGPAIFKFRGKVAASDVIFAEEGDCNVVGALTLAALGLVLDPLQRELRPLPSFLAWHVRY